MKRFALEVYEPGANQTASFSYECDEPWPAIGVGDWINPFMFDPPSDDARMRRVLSIEHLIWEAPGGGAFKHKVMVFTEAVAEADLPPNRTTRSPQS